MSWNNLTKVCSSKTARGDRIDFLVEADGKVYLQPVKVDVETLKGILHNPDREPVSVEQMDDAIFQNSFHSLPGAFSKR